MELKGKKIVVTGANGFIGGWLCARLLDKGAVVTGIVQDSERKGSLALHELTEELLIKEANVLDTESIESAIEGSEIVVHLAAQSSVTCSIENPRESFETNTMGTLNVLEACRKNNAGVIVASSGKVYGEQEKRFLSEEDQLLARDPYGASKACADVIAQTYFESYGLKGAITRLGNAYGPKDLNETRLITTTIQRVLTGKSPVINGKGTSKRDFVFIEDVVSAYLLILENIDSKKAIGQAFNIATEQQHSVKQVIEAVQKACGSKLKPEYTQQDYPEKNESVLSSQKIRKRLQWKPNYSLEKGLLKTIEWYKEPSEK